MNKTKLLRSFIQFFAIPWLILLFIDLSHPKPWIDLKPINVGFVEEKCAIEMGFFT
jgi:hypothetical protein